MSKEINFIAKARAWTRKNDLHGPHAFLRFVMMTFVEQLNSASDEFIFKGGNLLWLYIKTPRSTIDIDFVTKSLNTHDAVKNLLGKSCEKISTQEIVFSIASFREVSQQGQSGAAVTIKYRTAEGQENSFDLDIVYAIPTEITRVVAPINPEGKIAAASIENIVADKLAACHRFKSGNTRMKDFDDLWRIAMGHQLVDKSKLNVLLKSRKIAAFLVTDWITTEMNGSWQVHRRKNPDLPELREVIDTVNAWLGK